MGWIEGFDVSHWNGKGCVGNIVATADVKMEFCIIKATEGISYTDPNVIENAIAADDKYGLVVGLYHYARPDSGNTPEAEAAHFCKVVRDVTAECAHLPFLVLDWEGKALSYPISWIEGFVNEVVRIVGCKPMIYCSASVVPKLKGLEKLDCGIWIANRTGKVPNPTPWDVVTMWQYSSVPYDKDRFNGTVDQLLQYTIPYEYIKDWDPDDDDQTGGYCYCGCSCCNKE